MRLKVSFTADFSCPWCFIGERRLFRAIDELGSDTQIDIDYRPFELNPHIPARGMDRKEYRTRKFGSWEQSQAMDARVTAVGKTDGIALNFGRVTRTPNTLAAHSLMRLAAKEDCQRVLADKLFLAYFSDGRDLSDPAVLRVIASESELLRDQIDAVLGAREGEEEVRALEQEAYHRGIRGVPLFEIGAATISGAQPVAMLADALRRIETPRSPAAI